MRRLANPPRKVVRHMDLVYIALTIVMLLILLEMLKTIKRK